MHASYHNLYQLIYFAIMQGVVLVSEHSDNCIIYRQVCVPFTSHNCAYNYGASEWHGRN